MNQEDKKTFASSGDSPITNEIRKQNQLELLQHTTILRYGVGFDVHKEKIAVCIAAQINIGEIVVVKEHIFRASPSGIKEIMSFLQKYDPIWRFLMECTGVYHLPLYHALREEFPLKHNDIVAMNPLLLHRQMSELGKKTDRVDARSLAILSLYDQLIKPSYIGTPEFFKKRDLIRSYHKIMKRVTATKNQIHRLLHSINFKMTLDLNSDWSLDMLDGFSHSNCPFKVFFDEYLKRLQQQNCPCGVIEKHLSEIEEFGDITLSKEDQFSLSMFLNRLTLDLYIATRYAQEAEKYLIHDKQYLRLYDELLKVPGLGTIGVITILMEIGDYRRFENWKSFVRFCGIVPLISDSADKRVKGHVNRYSNALLRYILTQSAGVIINRCDRKTDLGEFAYKYFRLRKNPYKKTCIKVAQKLARIIYGILNGGIFYQDNYELIEKKRIARQRRLKRHGTYLESYRTRILKSRINSFLGDNYDLLNHSSRFLLTTGFKQILERSTKEDPR
jgi:transposase